MPSVYGNPIAKSQEPCPLLYKKPLLDLPVNFWLPVPWLYSLIQNCFLSALSQKNSYVVSGRCGWQHEWRKQHFSWKPPVALWRTEMQMQDHSRSARTNTWPFMRASLVPQPVHFMAALQASWTGFCFTGKFPGENSILFIIQCLFQQIFRILLFLPPCCFLACQWLTVTMSCVSGHPVTLGGKPRVKRNENRIYLSLFLCCIA